MPVAFCAVCLAVSGFEGKAMFTPHFSFPALQALLSPPLPPSSISSLSLPIRKGHLPKSAHPSWVIFVVLCGYLEEFIFNMTAVSRCEVLS